MNPATSQTLTELLAPDASDMLGLVTRSPQRGRKNYAIGQALALKPELFAGLHQVLFCGMGGSGSSGDLFQALGGTLPIMVCKSPILPAWVGPETLVVAISYSGNTYETLACVEQAQARGARLLALSSGGELSARAKSQNFPLLSIEGGLPPRSALFDMLFALLGVLQPLKALGIDHEQIVATLDRLDALSADWTLTENKLSADQPEPLTLAQSMQNAEIRLWGSEFVGAAVALRWKNQLAENSKVLASVSQLPELNHNEIVPMCAGHHSAQQLIYFTLENEIPAGDAVALDLVKPHLQAVATPTAQGNSLLERLLYFVYLGDFTSVYLALLQNIDPTPIASIDELKRRMA